MNVYDEAHSLVRAIKNTPEYTQYLELKERVSENPELTEMLNDFQAKQFEIQKMQLLGGDLGSEMTEQIQSLYQILMKDPLAAQYIQAEMRFTMMINDVYNILGEVVKFNQ